MLVTRVRLPACACFGSSVDSGTCDFARSDGMMASLERTCSFEASAEGVADEGQVRTGVLRQCGHTSVPPATHLQGACVTSTATPLQASASPRELTALLWKNSCWAPTWHLAPSICRCWECFRGRWGRSRWSTLGASAPSRHTGNARRPVSGRGKYGEGTVKELALPSAFLKGFWRGGVCGKFICSPARKPL